MIIVAIIIALILAAINGNLSSISNNLKELNKFYFEKRRNQR